MRIFVITGASYANAGRNGFGEVDGGSSERREVETGTLVRRLTKLDSGR